MSGSKRSSGGPSVLVIMATVDVLKAQIVRQDLAESWGFTLQGGSDTGEPLRMLTVCTGWWHDGFHCAILFYIDMFLIACLYRFTNMLEMIMLTCSFTRNSKMVAYIYIYIRTIRYD